MKFYRHSLLIATSCIIFISVGKAQTKAEQNYYYDQGYYLWYYEKLDSAFQMFDRYLASPTDSLKKGKAYYYLGHIQLTQGDLYGAQESLVNAVHTLDTLNKKHWEDLGIAYNVLGNVSMELKLYDDAINKYSEAIKYAGDDYAPEIMNGKALALQKKGKYSESIATYDSILEIKTLDQSLVARILSNRARTKWMQQPSSNVLPEFHAALKIRIDSQYVRGLNASYAHLSDYYTKINPDSAFWYANKMLKQATDIKSPEDILEAMNKIILLSKSPDQILYWYSEATKLRDSVQFAKDTSSNRFAAVRVMYNFQKSKTENLALQQKNIRQGILLWSVVLISLAIISAIYLINSKRRNRIRQESENAIRNASLKTSQKVHDVVANGLYSIMNELEHLKKIEREPLINKIEGLYEKSRNISYEDISPAVNTGYDTQFHELLHSFASEKTRVIIVGNQQTFWSKVTEQQKKELQLILNEMMINMKKHSHAKNVVIHFKQENKTAAVQYKDDGIGFPADVKMGNGLRNTVSRIKSINGAVNFGQNAGGGTLITINFPLQSDKT